MSLWEKLHRNECIPERYEFIPERNEYVPKIFRISTGIWGNQNYQKIRNFSGSKNLKEFFQNSKVLKSSYQTKPNLKSWNFEKILSDSYSLKNFWFFGSFGFPKFQYLSGIFSEHIHSVLVWIHTVLEYIHSGVTFLIVNVKALIGAFNHKKALVGAFSMIVKTLRNLRKPSFEALLQHLHLGS